MDIGAWLSAYGDPVGPEQLKSADAWALVRIVQRYAQELANVVEIRKGGHRELVVLDFQTGRPQRSAYDIKRCERIGIRFIVGNGMPMVYMLRADFPDTCHQLLTLEGNPRAICIDDRPWAEAQLTWTPGELIQRILSWFTRAVSGELHDARQPIDPVLIGSPLNFLISRETLENASDSELVGVHNTAHRQTLRIMPIQRFEGNFENVDPVCAFAYQVAPERMTRMKFAPGNLGSLADVLDERGIDLIADLRARLSSWLDAEKTWQLNSRFVVIVEMPIVSPRQEQQDGTDLRAYMTEKSAGDIAVALGIAVSAPPAANSKVGFVRPVGQTDIDSDVTRTIDVQVAEVHYEFDRVLSTQLTGRTKIDNRKAVIVGAGAIGSHVSECLMREGRFSWTVIDHDYLLPHNLGRHIGRSGEVTQNKAEVLAGALNDVLDGEPGSSAIPANLFADEPERSEIETALESADIIIDASASVLAERFLSGHGSGARRVSIFFTPSGDGAVLLAEPADRSYTLRDLEAQYLGLVARDERLSGHLVSPEETFAYTGACRAISNIIPESRVLLLSGLVASGLTRAVDGTDGVIRIWSVDDDENVESLAFGSELVQRQDVLAWQITVDEGVVDRILEMRNACLPNETGGILLGVVDIPGKSIHLVDAGGAPPDSQETATGFVRGRVGVQQQIDRVFEETRGQVRYVGEWHSHPPSVPTTPSGTDLVQIDWLSTLFDMDTLPALMLIAGDKSYSIILANQVAQREDDA
jgi:integrative and conjugative element protein (TIGR02256 family)